MSTLVLEEDRQADAIARHVCELKQAVGRPQTVNGPPSLPFVQHHRPSLPPKRTGPESYSIYVIGQKVVTDPRSKSCSDFRGVEDSLPGGSDVTVQSVIMAARKKSSPSARRRIIRTHSPSSRSCHVTSAKLSRSRDRLSSPGCYSAMRPLSRSDGASNPLHVTSDSVVLTSRPKSMMLGPRTSQHLPRCRTADVTLSSHKLTTKSTGPSDSGRKHNMTNDTWSSDNGRVAYIRTTMSLTKQDGRVHSSHKRSCRTNDTGLPVIPVWPAPLNTTHMLRLQQALRDKDIQFSIKDLLRTGTCRSQIRIDQDHETRSNFGHYSVHGLEQLDNKYDNFVDPTFQSDVNFVAPELLCDDEPASAGDVNCDTIKHLVPEDTKGPLHNLLEPEVDLKTLSVASKIPGECYEKYESTRSHKVIDAQASQLNGDELGQASRHTGQDEYFIAPSSHHPGRSECGFSRTFYRKHGQTYRQNIARDVVRNGTSAERTSVGIMNSGWWDGEKPVMELTADEVMASDHSSTSEASTTSGTSTATFPGSDLLYGADGGLPKMAHVDYLARSDLSNYEKERQRLRDLEVVNKRPSSRGGKRASYPFVDKEVYDREREDGRALNGQAIIKPQPYKGPTVSSSLPQRPNGSNSVRESDELIAMGTLFSPTNYVTANGVTRGSSTTTASSRSNQYGGPQNGPPTTNSVPQRKNLTFSMNSTKQTSNLNGMTPQRQLGANFNVREDPKYPDPLVGATASYQQRLMELAALETETIRWERTKKVKKKT